MEKQILLRGISRTPSDRMAGDGGCAESLNVHVEEKELRATPAPKDVTEQVSGAADLDGVPVFLHKTPDYENIIIYERSSNKLQWYSRISPDVRVYGGSVYRTPAETSTGSGVWFISISYGLGAKKMKVGEYIRAEVGGTQYYFLINEISHHVEVTTLLDDYYCTRLAVDSYQDVYAFADDEELKDIKSIGNTMLVLTDKRLEYVLFKQGRYYDLGDRIPDAHIDVKAVALSGSSYVTVLPNCYGEYSTDYRNFVYTDITHEEILENQAYSHARYVNELYPDIKEALEASLITAEKDNLRAGAMSKPAFFRYAVRLYDGSYVRHSAPIFVDPNNFSGSGIKGEWHFNYNEATEVVFIDQLTYMVSPYRPDFVLDDVDDFDNWRDIVSGIDIFMSPTLELQNFELWSIEDASYTEGGYSSSSIVVKADNEDEQLEKVLSSSNFYRIISIDVNDYVDGGDRTENVDDYMKLRNDSLVTLPRLNDDLNTNIRFVPGGISVFNSRLVLSGAKAEYMDGYYDLPSTVEDSGHDYLWRIKYYIQSVTGDVVSVMSGTYSTEDEALGAWLYYPDMRCYKADVYRSADGGSTWYLTTVEMKEDKYLNGAYYFAGFGTTGWWDGASASVDEKVQPFARRDNRLYQSQVSNPFVFPLEQQFTGRLMAVAPVTRALSSGQFGYADLYAFTDEGIWAMGLASDGTISNVKVVSQDVAVEGTVCPIDQAIVFTSRKGVMLLAGSDVKEISENMIGKHQGLSSGVKTLLSSTGWKDLADMSDAMTFMEFAKGARTLYDYEGGRLVMLRADKCYVYVYIFATGTWHKMALPDGYEFVRLINSYPDAYAGMSFTREVEPEEEGDSSTEVTTYRVLDFTMPKGAMPDAQDTDYRRKALVMTRPFDLGANDVRKVLKHLMVRGFYKQDSSRPHMQYILEASMDGMNWGVVNSLRGGSYKLFRIVLLLDFEPDERISYLDVEYDTRFAGRMR